MRLIDADELKKAFEDTVCIEPMPYAFVKQIIDNAPTVQHDEIVIQEVLNKRCMTAVANEYLVALHGKRPQGKWIFKHNSSDIWCSVCDENFDEIPQKFNYCPNCGADMRGDTYETS